VVPCLQLSLFCNCVSYIRSRTHSLARLHALAAHGTWHLARAHNASHIHRTWHTYHTCYTCHTCYNCHTCHPGARVRMARRGLPRRIHPHRHQWQWQRGEQQLCWCVSSHLQSTSTVHVYSACIRTTNIPVLVHIHNVSTYLYVLVGWWLMNALSCQRCPHMACCLP
jgi:hypothetical protein